MTETVDLPWMTTVLKKGQVIRKEIGVAVLTVHHMDRRLDPYMATVEKNGVVTYTGAHLTLGQARQKCEREA